MDIPFGQGEFEGLGFEAAGVSLKQIGPLTRLGSESIGTQPQHRLVKQQAKAFQESIGGVVVEEFRIGGA